MSYFLANVKKGEDEILRSSNADLRAANTDLLQQVRVLETDRDKVMRENDVLRDLVSGSTAIQKMHTDLLALFKEHESNAEQRFRLFIESQDRVAEAIGHFMEAVREARR